MPAFTQALAKCRGAFLNTRARAWIQLQISTHAAIVAAVMAAALAAAAARPSAPPTLQSLGQSSTPNLPDSQGSHQGEQQQSQDSAGHVCWVPAGKASKSQLFPCDLGSGSHGQETMEWLQGCRNVEAGVERLLTQVRGALLAAKVTFWRSLQTKGCARGAGWACMQKGTFHKGLAEDWVNACARKKATGVLRGYWRLVLVLRAAFVRVWHGWP